MDRITGLNAVQQKLGPVRRVLELHGREAICGVKVIDVRQAFVGLHARPVVLVSQPALDLACGFFANSRHQMLRPFGISFGGAMLPRLHELHQDANRPGQPRPSILASGSPDGRLESSSRVRR